MVHSHHFLVACSVLDHELFHYVVVVPFTASTPNPRSCFTAPFFCPFEWVRLLEVQPSIFVFWGDEYTSDSQRWFNMSLCEIFGMLNMLSHCWGHLNTPLDKHSTCWELVQWTNPLDLLAAMTWTWTRTRTMKMPLKAHQLQNGGERVEWVATKSRNRSDIFLPRFECNTCHGITCVTASWICTKHWDFVRRV